MTCDIITLPVGGGRSGSTWVLLVDCPRLWLSNEAGMGIMPGNALARRFRDATGRLNQQVAGVADTVLLVAAGLSIRMK